ncbi:MAG: hypothetical protein GXP55_12800 [Deltaproteobacteria bacterium]|nr:hypothetical protein [Deltaproteobacteria bacterium]
MVELPYVKPVDRLLEEGLEAYGVGKEERAAELWVEALKLDPRNQQAREYLEAAGVEPPSIADVVTLHPPGSERAPAPSLNRKAILEAVQARDFERALELLYQARARQPSDTSLSLSILPIKKQLTMRYERRIGDLDAIAGRTFHQLDRELSENAQKVLSLVDGISSFGDVLQSSTVGRFETLHALSQLLDLEAIGVAQRPRTRSRPDLPAVRSVREPPPSERPDADVLRSAASCDSPVAPDAQSAAEDTPESYASTLKAGTRAYLRRDYAEAERCFRHCLQIRPDDTRALHNLKRLELRKESG